MEYVNTALHALDVGGGRMLAEGERADLSGSPKKLIEDYVERGQLTAVQSERAEVEGGRPAAEPKERA